MYADDVEKIAEFLEDNYPEEDIALIKLAYLEEMVRSLNELEDEEIQLSKEKLQEIKETWLMLRDHS